MASSGRLVGRSGPSRFSHSSFVRSQPLARCALAKPAENHDRRTTSSAQLHASLSHSHGCWVETKPAGHRYYHVVGDAHFCVTVGGAGIRAMRPPLCPPAFMPALAGVNSGIDEPAITAACSNAYHDRGNDFCIVGMVRCRAKVRVPPGRRLGVPILGKPVPVVGLEEATDRETTTLFSCRTFTPESSREIPATAASFRANQPCWGIGTDPRYHRSMPLVLIGAGYVTVDYARAVDDLCAPPKPIILC